MTDLFYPHLQTLEIRKEEKWLTIIQTHNGFAIKRGKITMEIYKEPEKEKKIENRFHR